jgi:signal transduction histidine kinase
LSISSFAISFGLFGGVRLLLAVSSMALKDEKLLMQIHDDGIGLPPALNHPQKDSSLVYNSPSGHYGLRGMLERIEAIDGHLTLHSGKEQGTTLEVEVPLAHSEPL